MGSTANPSWTFLCTAEGCSFNVNVTGDTLAAQKDNAAAAALRHEDETGHTVSERPVPYYGEAAQPALD